VDYSLYRTSGTIPACIQNEFEKLQARYPSLKEWYLVPIDSVIGQSETVGGCRIHYKHIVLCKWLWELNPPNHPDIIDVLYHEVAHALISPHNKHNEVWQQMAKEVGCKHCDTIRMREWTTLSVPPHLEMLS